jgi:hypothetical protein
MNKLAIALAALLAGAAGAQPQARSTLDLRITVAPTFNIVGEQPVEGGTMVTADTNMREVTINGATIRLGPPGRQTFFVPTPAGAPDGLIIARP